MSTPERRLDRATHSRRKYHQPPPQQQSQQLSPNRSPFRPGHYESRLDDRLDASKIPSPSQTYSARRRRAFSQTGTLRGAFNAVSRHPAMEGSDHLYSLGSPGRGDRRRPNFNPTSPESNPPNELMEAYRQINDAGSLVDPDELDEDLREPLGFHESHGRSSSSGSAFRDDAGLFLADHELLNDITDDSLRRRPIDHVKDELRLKRATSSRSPVLNRTGTSPALTSENLQRREEEAREALENAVEVDDYDDGQRPSLNLPRTWGSRGTHRRDWLKSMARRNEPESDAVINEPRDSPPKSNSGLDSQKSPPQHQSSQTPNTLRERLANTYNRFPLSDVHNRVSELREDQPAGDHGLNTPPVMVYKSSTFNKRSPTKRDSHDLLRKLSRTESPGQNLRTPEAQKIPGTRIYDKTPVVTGAWIDTPMTERATPRPDFSSGQIMASPARRNLPEPSQTTNEERVAEEPKTSGSQPQKSSNAETKQTPEPKSGENENRTSVDRKLQEGAAKGTGEQREQANTQGAPEKKEKTKRRPPLAKPDHPKSALETVMEDFKADKNSLDVGDDTLESLQEILNEQVNEVKSEAEDDAAYEKSVLEKLERANSENRDSADFISMNEKLASLSNSMTQVKEGIDDLGDQVKSMPSPDGKSSKLRQTCGNCEACQTHNDGSIYTIIPIPKLWKRSSPSGRIRPTRLGWCAIVLFMWYCSESTMCDFYCHPFIADVCEGNCLLPDAPRFPFVIPTMLWRWSHLQGVLAPLWAISMAFFRLIGQLLGLWDGYVEETPRALNLSGEIWVHGNRLNEFSTAAVASNKPWQEEDVRYAEAVPTLNLGQGDDASMDDDEYV
ncbi:hypothetical protein BDV59DRAFT_169813 [Aspergillus ambiguus]|uniref:uncharacterized protein n=1 Tax=Aspergillus ambiguus TaxID=176160 RepID=UPI003CCDFD4B